jgi:dipeptidyl aminopeptidase/acylaminoacyl peptidase
MKTIPAIAFASFVLGTNVILARPANPSLFSTNKDIGWPRHAGSVVCHPSAGTYLVSGGGSNMWARTDDFHFVYKEMSGDLSFSAGVRWPKPGGNPHRKACLMIRQSLDPDSPYVDVAQHGVGLTALQFREAKRGNTQEIQSGFSGPARIGLEKRGDYVSFWISNNGEELHPAGGSFKLPLTKPFYVGLAVSAHDNNTIEQAEFSRVELKALPPLAAHVRGQVQSTLEFMPIASTDRTIVYHTNVNIQAPHWTRDNHLIFNCGGRWYKIGITNGSVPEPINIQDPGLDDTPEHSPDGQYIYFNSERSGLMQIWRMKTDDSEQTQMTPNDGHNNWFAHISPDGRRMVFLTFDKDVKPNDHPASRDVTLRMMPANGGAITTLAKFFGGEGTINVPSWSPDSRNIAFVTCTMIFGPN